MLRRPLVGRRVADLLGRCAGLAAPVEWDQQDIGLAAGPRLPGQPDRAVRRGGEDGVAVGTGLRR